MTRKNKHKGLTPDAPRQGLIQYYLWQNSVINGQAAIAFANRRIQDLADPMTFELKDGFKWRFLLTVGATFQAKFQQAEKAEGKCPYWVQFATYTETKLGNQATTSWEFDTPDFNEKYYLKKYRHSIVDSTRGLAEMVDNPGRVYESDPQTDIAWKTGTDSKAGNPVTIFVLNPGVLPRNLEFTKDVHDQYSVDMKFQTYLVSCL